MVHACPMGLFGPLGGVGHHHGLYIPHGDTYFHGNIRPACLRGRVHGVVWGRNKGGSKRMNSR
jgi:hypothetical protein